MTMMGSIRARLLAGTALGVSLTFAVAGILIFVVTRTQLFAQFDDGLMDRARALTALIEQAGNTIETDLAREDVQTEFHQVWLSTGKVLRRSVSLGVRDLARPTESGITEVTLPNGNPGRQATLVFQPHQDPEDGPPAPPVTLTFAVARDVDELDATVARLGRVLVMVGFAATLLCVALLAWIVRFGLSPVRKLAASIAQLREENLSARLDAASSPEELQPVVERLNELLRRLEGAFARERELTAEVAHELRTPMSGLRATIELALDRERTPERYRTALSDCLSITIQTQSMVESLLSLARLDAGMVAVKSEQVQLDDLVREVIAQQSARASERELVVTTELAPVAHTTDRDKLRVIVHNLVDNAVSYADHGGSVRVELAAGSIIRVANTGCALTNEQAKQVFDRFWRGDAARSGGGTHAGVGLALSKKLVDLLGGSISVEVKEREFIATVVLTPTSSIGVDSSRRSP